jgi:hypothetical protein
MKNTERMIMTGKLANQLMDTLACVAISATGGAIQDADGNYNQEQMDFAQEYARQTFCDILESWEEQMGKQWGIEDLEEVE